MAAAGKVARHVKAPIASRPRDVSMGVPLLACPAMPSSLLDKPAVARTACNARHRAADQTANGINSNSPSNRVTDAAAIATAAAKNSRRRTSVTARQRR